MQRGRSVLLGAFAGALVLSAAAKPSHAQGNLQAFPRAGGVVQVSWLASPDPAVVGYNVYRRGSTLTADKAELATPQPITASTFMDSGPNGQGLPLGQPLIYSVRAVAMDSSGKAVEISRSPESSVTPQNATTLPPGDFFYYDIDTTNPGSISRDGNILTIRASGPPLWDKFDGHTFLAMPVSGDYTLTASLSEHPVNEDPDNGAGNAKVGIEIRAGLHKMDPTAFVFSSAQREPPVLYEGRHATNGDVRPWSLPEPTGDADVPYPLLLRLEKVGAVVTALVSHDKGQTYLPVGEPQDFGVLPPVTYAGLFVSADRDGQYTIGKYAIDSIKIEKK
jgi:hypothetical protein